MAGENVPAGDELVPDLEYLDLPRRLTSEDSADLRRRIARYISEAGIARRIDESIEANISEFTAILTSMFEKIRNDVQPRFLHVIDELNRISDERHTAFLDSLDTAFRELVNKAQGLEGEKIAWEKLKERQETLDKDHDKRRAKLIAATEKEVKDLISSLFDHNFKADPKNQELARKFERVVRDNGKLKEVMADTYRLAEEIGLFNYKTSKRKILDKLRKIVDG